jgi:hypothetical protein
MGVVIMYINDPPAASASIDREKARVLTRVATGHEVVLSLSMEDAARLGSDLLHKASLLHSHQGGCGYIGHHLTCECKGAGGGR